MHPLKFFYKGKIQKNCQFNMHTLKSVLEELTVLHLVATLDPLACWIVPLDPLACWIVPLDPLACWIVPLDPLACWIVPLDPLACWIVPDGDVIYVSFHITSYQETTHLLVLCHTENLIPPAELSSPCSRLLFLLLVC